MSKSETQKVSDWWQTSIIDMAPGEIRYRGYPIEELIGNINFAQMVWLMLRGELPTEQQARLLDAVLMSAIDHGPQAPSIAIARMASTCGVGLNNAVASAVNVLGDVHGGAGEQAMELYIRIKNQTNQTTSLEVATKIEIEKILRSTNKFIPGFGHRFHPIDPRAPRLLELVDQAAKAKTVRGTFATIARLIEKQIHKSKGKLIPMNIDGATAVIYAELGFEPPLARGLFCLSRSVGILAHAWEQRQQGGRNKGPIPTEINWTYTGKSKRSLS